MQSPRSDLVGRRTLLLGSAAGALTACTALPRPPKDMVFGSAAFTPPLVADYERQRSELGIRSVFVYQPAEASWSELCRAVPPTDDIWLSVGTTQVGALLEQIPTWRTGKVYLHYHQEPHDDMDFDTWARMSRAVLSQAAGHPAIVPSAEFSAYAFLNEPDGRWHLDGVRCYGFSSFADIRVEDNHVVATTDPRRQLDALSRWAAAVGADWSLAACGFPLPVTHVGDQQSSENRAAWTRAHLTAARQLGALHYQWFNVLWERTTPALDYRIESDTALVALWATRSRL